MDKEDRAWENANSVADEMDRDELRSGLPRAGPRVASFNMRDIHRFSTEEPNKHPYTDFHSANVTAPALAQPAIPTEQKIEKTAEANSTSSSYPQSGSPISDAILDGLKKATGKEVTTGQDGKKNAVQTSEASSSSVGVGVHDKLEE